MIHLNLHIDIKFVLISRIVKWVLIRRLVKWVLYDEDREWVDINFRYDPRVNAQFSLSLPSLQQTEYYSVEWAILDDVEQLIKGVYNFSFGPGAEVASVIRAREGQMDHSMHEM